MFTTRFRIYLRFFPLENKEIAKWFKAIDKITNGSFAPKQLKLEIK